MESDRVVIITGCSRGIGVQLAVQLSQKSKYKVIATLRTPSSAPVLLKESSCDIQPLDVTQDASINKLSSYVTKTYGGCDVLINNAGFGIPGSIEAVTIGDAKRVFDVNVWGVMRVCQKFVPQMRERGGGLVLTVSSTSGVCGQPHADIYTASKMAVEGLLESYRYAVEKDNIKIVLVNPGPTDTDFGLRYQTEGELQHSKDNRTSFWMGEVARRNANGQPSDECAREIITVIEREIGKDVRDGKDSVSFWNPTSDFSRRVVTSVLKNPDGHTGIYAERFEAARKVEKELDDTENQEHETG